MTSNSKESSTNEEIPLQNIDYSKDEYGYLEDKKISRELFNQLPSRQLQLVESDLPLSESSCQTLRRRYSHYRSTQLSIISLSSHALSSDADKLYQLLTADPNATQEEKLITLKEMHQSLSIKRRVKEKLNEDLRRAGSLELDQFTRLKLRTNRAWSNWLFKIKTTLYSLEPWHYPIKAVQGQFGSAAASYFIFLRWLLYINIGNFFISLFFIVIPQVTYQKFSSEYNESESHLNYSAENLTFSDFITGSGWLSDSLMYFGHYTHKTIHVAPGLVYNMPLAYLFTVGVYAIVNLIAVSYSLTSAHKQNYIDMSGDLKQIFCNKVFAAWDYSTETEDAANLKKMAFCNETRELLSFKRQNNKKKKLTQRIVDGFFIVLFNLVGIGIIGAVGFLTYYLLSEKILESDTLREMTLASVVTAISLSLYFLFKYFTKLEKYLQRKTKLYLTMIRVTILRTVILSVIVYFWTVADSSAKKLYDCFETELGKEIYRLILTNFLMTVICCTLFKDVTMKLIRIYKPNLKFYSFDVAFNTLDLIYLQTLTWIGNFCMPFVSLMVVIILIILFYIKLSIVVSCCRPPKRTWSVNEAQAFFLILIFFMFVLTAFIVGYVLFFLTPSPCGPFKEYKQTSEIIHEAFLHKGEEHQSSKLLKYISSPGVMFSFLCALCVVVYFMKAQAKAHASVKKKVREQFVLGGKDKVFLLKLFSEALPPDA